MLYWFFSAIMGEKMKDIESECPAYGSIPPHIGKQAVLTFFN
jgi:hypothetical protein